MRRLMIMASLILLLGSACKSEIDGKTAATVTEATETTAAPDPEPSAATQAETTEVPMDTAASKIEWVGAKVTGDHQGGFKTFTGSVTYGPDGSLAGVKTEIDTTSVYTDVEKLTKHLKSADFFDVETHPKASFVSQSIAKNVDGTHAVTGQLDLHGVQKTITFPAKVTREGGNTVAIAEFTLKRFDFNIEYKGKPDDLIKDDVLMKLKVVAPAPAES